MNTAQGYDVQAPEATSAFHMLVFYVAQNVKKKKIERIPTNILFS
jgi:hypothetical protein